MKFERTEVFNFEGALRGMRNPLESWDKSDSRYSNNGKYIIGENDLNLAKRLIKAGGEHRKFMRQIFVSVDITAPRYWWVEADTYSVGVTKNSTSTMHKIMSKPFADDMFEIDDIEIFERGSFVEMLNTCEKYRLKYIEYKDNDPKLAKKFWKALIRILPQSFLQTRTITMNYENLYNIVRQRAGHKLKEWKVFIDWVRTLPYAEEFIF